MDIMDAAVFLPYLGWGLSVLFGFVIMMNYKDILMNLQIMMSKKRGIKEVFVVRGDRTVTVEAHVPKDNTTIKRGDRVHTIDKNAMFYDKNKGCQAVFIREGDQYTYDPLSRDTKGIDPQLIENLGYELYYAGFKAAGRDYQRILYAALAAAGCALGALVISFMVLQNVGTIQAGMFNLIQLLGEQSGSILLKPM